MERYRQIIEALFLKEKRIKKQMVDIKRNG